jgi:hypothetical protein
MGYEPGLGGLVEQIKQASENIADGDARMNKRLDGIEKSINELYLKHGRPGGFRLRTTWPRDDTNGMDRPCSCP